MIYEDDPNDPIDWEEPDEGGGGGTPTEPNLFISYIRKNEHTVTVRVNHNGETAFCREIVIKAAVVGPWETYNDYDTLAYTHIYIAEESYCNEKFIWGTKQPDGSYQFEYDITVPHRDWENNYREVTFSLSEYNLYMVEPTGCVYGHGAYNPQDHPWIPIDQGNMTIGYKGNIQFDIPDLTFGTYIDEIFCDASTYYHDRGADWYSIRHVFKFYKPPYGYRKYVPYSSECIQADPNAEIDNPEAYKRNMLTYWESMQVKTDGTYVNNYTIDHTFSADDFADYYPCMYGIYLGNDTLRPKSYGPSQHVFEVIKKYKTDNRGAFSHVQNSVHHNVNLAGTPYESTYKKYNYLLENHYITKISNRVVDIPANELEPPIFIPPEGELPPPGTEPLPGEDER